MQFNTLISLEIGSFKNESLDAFSIKYTKSLQKCDFSILILFLSRYSGHLSSDVAFAMKPETRETLPYSPLQNI